MNLVTAVGRRVPGPRPLVALTGQADVERMHKESHQYIDLVELFRPITKWNARVSAPEIIPEVVRKAFKVAEAEKPGATHLELPEDVMSAQVEAAPLPAAGRPSPSRAPASCSRRPTSSATRSTPWPSRATASCAAAPRPPCASSCAPRASRSRRRSWARASWTTRTSTRSARSACSPATTPWRASRTPTWSSRSATTSVEHAPKHWNPGRDKTIVCIDAVAARSTSSSSPRWSSSARSTTCSRAGRGVPRRAVRRPRPRPSACARSCSAASRRPRRTTRSPSSPRGRCGTSARRSGRRTCSSPMSGSTSCGSAGCSPRTSPTPS
jgi:acetolactate synthase-1/2/3 large subunit